jgi:hypothetical protein
VVLVGVSVATGDGATGVGVSVRDGIGVGVSVGGAGVGVEVGGTGVGVAVGGSGVGVAVGSSGVEVAVGATDTDEVPHETKKNTDSVKQNICNSDFLCFIFFSPPLRNCCYIFSCLVIVVAMPPMKSLSRMDTISPCIAPVITVSTKKPGTCHNIQKNPSIIEAHKPL